MAAILSISSQVVAGAVGNSASVYPLMRLGHNVWSLPSLLLSHHPGLGQPAKLTMSANDLEAFISSLESHGLLENCDALMTGYLADAGQGDVIAALVTRLRQHNPDLIYLCDPISGDEAEGSYVSAAVIAAQQRLMTLADIVTPNRFELSLFTGRAIHDDATAIAAARSLHRPLVVVTSAPAAPGRIANLCVTPLEACRAETHEHRALAGSRVPKGTGDLFAGLFFAHHLGGATHEHALSQASAATADMVGLSLAHQASDLLLGPGSALIETPDAIASTRFI